MPLPGCYRISSARSQEATLLHTAIRRPSLRFPITRLLVCLLSLAALAPAATTTIPGIVFQGSWDGHLRAHDSRNGRILWQYDSAFGFGTSLAGNVLLAFTLDAN